MVDTTLLEIKAKVDSLDAVREILRFLEAKYIGTFQQTDTYFNTPKGRLKIREVKGEEKAKLIYYEREDISKPKRSDVSILLIQSPSSFITFLTKVLGTKVIVRKIREIYIHRETQIHLDDVQGLGTFIEFEKETQNITDDNMVLQELMNTLNIEFQDLIKNSYSDLLLTRN